MNKYFEKNDGFNSNNRIYEGYFTEVNAAPGFGKRVLDLLSTILGLLLCERFLHRVKLVVVALSLIGLIGVVGAMDAGSLGMGSGLLIGAALVAAEYLCLKGRHRS